MGSRFPQPRQKRPHRQSPPTQQRSQTLTPTQRTHPQRGEGGGTTPASQLTVQIDARRPHAELSALLFVLFLNVFKSRLGGDCRRCESNAPRSSVRVYRPVKVEREANIGEFLNGWSQTSVGPLHCPPSHRRICRLHADGLRKAASNIFVRTLPIANTLYLLSLSSCQTIPSIEVLRVALVTRNQRMCLQQIKLMKGSFN